MFIYLFMYTNILSLSLYIFSIVVHVCVCDAIPGSEGRMECHWREGKMPYSVKYSVKVHDEMKNKM